MACNIAKSTIIKQTIRSADVDMAEATSNGVIKEEEKPEVKVEVKEEVKMEEEDEEDPLDAYMNNQIKKELAPRTVVSTAVLLYLCYC